MKYALAALLCFIPSAALAGSSSVDISHIRAHGEAGAAVASRVRITNTDTTDQRYEISMPPALAGRASAAPEQFSLAPGESRDVVLRFRMPEETQQSHITLVSHDSRQHAAFKVASGIQIPVSFSVPRVAGVALSAPPPAAAASAWTVAVYAIDGILLVAAAHLMRRHKVKNCRPRYQISFV